jgi:hypothetical protein
MRRAGWDAALDEVARQLRRVRERRVGIRRAIDRDEDVAVDAAHETLSKGDHSRAHAVVCTPVIDELDARLLLMLRAHPRIGLIEVARRL